MEPIENWFNQAIVHMDNLSTVQKRNSEYWHHFRRYSIPRNGHCVRTIKLAKGNALYIGQWKLANERTNLTINRIQVINRLACHWSSSVKLAGDIVRTIGSNKPNKATFQSNQSGKLLGASPLSALQSKLQPYSRKLPSLSGLCGVRDTTHTQEATAESVLYTYL